jgi:hypothetical protein
MLYKPQRPKHQTPDDSHQVSKNIFRHISTSQERFPRRILTRDSITFATAFRIEIASFIVISVSHILLSLSTLVQSSSTESL